MTADVEQTLNISPIFNTQTLQTKPTFAIEHKRPDVYICSMKKRVLFLCTGNSCRSQMADGIINHDFAGQIEAFSAGTEPHGLNPKAVKVMTEIGIDISDNSSDHLNRFEGQAFDYVITLCGDANDKCPLFVGGVERIHIGFDDPPRATGSDDEIMDVYRLVRDEIRAQLGPFFRKELNQLSS
jgi:arsenate reductase